MVRCFMMSVILACLCGDSCGDVLAETNEFIESLRRLQKMRYENKERVEQFMDEAKAYEQRGEYKLAKVSYICALASAHILGKIARHYSQQGVHDLVAESVELIEDIERRIQIVEQLSIYDAEVKINALHRSGIAKMESRDYARAISAFDSAIAGADALAQDMVERGDVSLAVKYKRLAQVSRDHAHEAQQAQMVSRERRRKNKAIAWGLCWGVYWGSSRFVPTVQGDILFVIFEHAWENDFRRE